MKKISLKICGITNSQSVKTAHINKIKSLGFASNNLKGPNTATDKKIQLLIKECKNYKIESVLLTRYISLNKLIEQIDYTKPKTISCSYHYKKNELKIIRKIFKKLKIGIAVNPENYNISYLKDIKNFVNIIYYDLNVYKIKTIKTYSLKKCLNQIKSIKNLSIPIYIGGGIDEHKAKEVIKLLNPDGIDVSRGLKTSKNILSNRKLKKFLQQVAIA